MDQKPVLNSILDKLQFRADDHTYWHDGKLVPNVTGVIDWLNNYAGADPEDMERARQIGENVHIATALYDRDDLVEESVDNAVRPYLAAYVRFLRETEFALNLIEQPVISVKHWFAGTLDRTGYLPLKGEHALIDLKTTKKLMPGNGPQTAAYKQGLIDCGFPGALYLSRYSLQLCPEKEPPYHLHKHSDPHDLNVFMCSLTLANWRRNHGIK